VTGRVRFKDQLPGFARISVLGTLMLDEREHVLNLRGPQIDEGTTQCTSSGRPAVRTAVQLGAASSLGNRDPPGLTEADRVIVSDTRDFNANPTSACSISSWAAQMIRHVGFAVKSRVSETITRSPSVSPWRISIPRLMRRRAAPQYARRGRPDDDTWSCLRRSAGPAQISERARARPT